VVSHRDYWFVSLDDGMVLTVSRDSVSKVVLVSAMKVVDGKPELSQPVEAQFDPDALEAGVVMGSGNGFQRTVTKVSKVPRLAFTGPVEK
jgi:hypothetical protein